ncbi:phospholipase D-like domain-containing protein [Propionivibrio sp.]|uniref:phospholipase D-like domain-containing protein n=1 Tax=Propionivibrio sp. TaxID=2212460 RepID=UPI00262C661C|nr:phospholipase D-like domain-containing protein [Propionivibrio sp.]
MSELFGWLSGLIGLHWKMLDALLVAVGLVIYVAASHTLHQRRHPSAAIAWVMGILLVPYVTLPLYLAFGSRKVVAPRPAQGARRMRANAANTPAARAQQLGAAMGLPDPAVYSELGIHDDGRQALVALRRIILGASQTLEVSTFVFGRDVLGDEIAEKLKQKARAGVRVRLLIDGIGVYLGGYPDLKGFAEAGVEVLRFVPPFRSTKRGRTNLRNHRKMVIADGRHLWCGGRNLSAEYFEGDPRPILGSTPWLDLSFDLDGELAGQAQQQFEQDWAFASERPTPAPKISETPAPDVKTLAQLVASGPDQPDDTIFTLLISGCFTSQQRILAVTPYFVPDTALITALSLAARRGIEVDLVLPARSNHRLADFARHRAMRDLVAAGARIWLHPHMIHAKAVLIDDDFSLVGSANLDGRSLFLNYEMMIAFYDHKAVHGFSSWVEARRQECAPYVVRTPGMARELAEGLLLWLAFQL